MFANPYESYKLYEPRNLGICCCCWIYSVTPLYCSRLRDSRVPRIEKVRTQKWEKLGRGRAAPTPLPLPFFLVLRSYFRVSFTYKSFLLYLRGWNHSLPSSSALYCLLKLELLRHLVNNALCWWYCPLFTQQDSHSISFVVFSLALFMCFPGLKGYPPNRWSTMGESTFPEFP